MELEEVIKKYENIRKAVSEDEILLKFGENRVISDLFILDEFIKDLKEIRK